MPDSHFVSGDEVIDPFYLPNAATGIVREVSGDLVLVEWQTDYAEEWVTATTLESASEHDSKEGV